MVSVPCFFLTTVAFATCIWRPRFIVYTISLAVWSALVVGTFMSLPPEDWVHGMSCGGRVLYKGTAAAATKSFQILQTMMCLMLMSTLVVPSERSMYPFLWGGIAGYVAFALIADGPLTWDTSVAVFYLFGISLFVIDYRRGIETDLREQFMLDIVHKDSSVKLFEILGYMLPPFIVTNLLKDPGGIIAESIDQASILFVMMEEFDQLASRTSPEELLSFLNRYFTNMDRMCIQHKVTKIETVGAEYVCAVGVVPEDRDFQETHGHQDIVERLIKVARDILDLQYKQREVAFRMGMHTGPIVAGVVGSKLPRFRLFGDTINTAARMMQKGLPGELQFGEATRSCLPDSVQFSSRGLIEMKGKGQVRTYLLRHANTNRTWLRVPSGGSATPTPSHPSIVSGQRPQLLRCLSSVVGTRFADMDVGCRIDSFRTVDRVNHSIDGTTSRFDELITAMEMPRTKARRCGTCVSRFQDQDHESQFQLWFHTKMVCVNIFDGGAWRLLQMLLLTVFEVVYLIIKRKAYVSMADFIGLVHYLDTYLICRGVCLLMLSCWARAGRCRTFMLEWRATVQALILVSKLVFVTCIFVGYNSLQWVMVQSVDDDCITCGLTSNIVTLAFWPLYIFTTEDRYPVLSTLSTSHVVLAITLVCLDKFSQPESSGNRAFDPFIFTMIFICRSLVVPLQACLKERGFRKRYQMTHAVESTRVRIGGILETLLPPLVVEAIETNPAATVPHHHYRHATIAQSDLVGFTELASTRRPKEVVEIIGEIFGLFDALTDKYDIYKVETVGDAYIAGQAEKPLTIRNSPLLVARFAASMVEAVHAWSQDRTEAVSCRVGVHSGECVGGIVGNEMQRYHLFGNLMTELEVLESTAPRGRVQLSEACMQAINADIHGQKEGLSFDLRPEPELTTSKGEVHLYKEVGGRTYLLSLADQNPAQLAEPGL